MTFNLNKPILSDRVIPFNLSTLIINRNYMATDAESIDIKFEL